MSIYPKTIPEQGNHQTTTMTSSFNKNDHPFSASNQNKSLLSGISSFVRKSSLKKAVTKITHRNGSVVEEQLSADGTYKHQQTTKPRTTTTTGTAETGIKKQTPHRNKFRNSRRPSKLCSIMEASSGDDAEEMALIDETDEVSSSSLGAKPNSKSKIHDNKHHNCHLSYDPNAAWQAIQHEQVFVPVPTVSATNNSSCWMKDSIYNDCTRIVCMSDTHGKHREIFIPEGDILVHGGDFTSTGEVDMTRDFVNYLQENQEGFSHIVCISGNHDLTMDAGYYDQNWNRFHKTRLPDEDARQAIFEHAYDPGRNNNKSPSLSTREKGETKATARRAAAEEKQKMVYLQDESCEIVVENNCNRIFTGGKNEGDKCTPASIISFYGSPWSPEFYNWAFNIPRGQPSWDIWSKVPKETDVLITHGPPLGRGDLCTDGARAGCYDLLQHVQSRVRPRLHIFGHIHEGYGASYDGTTLFVNASNLDFAYESVHPCIVIDLPHDSSQPARVVQPRCNLSAKNFLEQVLLQERLQGTSYMYPNLANAVQKSNITPDELPSGDVLLQAENVYHTLLPRVAPSHVFPPLKSKIKQELRMALSALYAASF